MRTVQDYREQSAVWHFLTGVLPGSKVPHALLITGISGTGKRSLANLIARVLLCEGSEKPCGHCKSCVQMEKLEHPDYTVLRPGEPIAQGVDKGKKIIPVDDIREVARIVRSNPFESAHRVIVIEQAEAMNANAQNALLKTLEEPPEYAHFLLTTEFAGALLPTVLSRCQELKLLPWPEAWLAGLLETRGTEHNRAVSAARLSGGSIGKALAIAGDADYWTRRDELMQGFFCSARRSDVARVSDRWKDSKDSAGEIFDILEDMIRTLMMVRTGRADAALLDAYPVEWRRMAGEADLRVFASLLDALANARLMQQNQVTWQAVMEQLLLKFMEEKDQWQKS